LIALNELWADILHHTLGSEVVLQYRYDGSDITFYLIFELPHLNKMFSVPVNATTETKKWLTWIDAQQVTTVGVGYTDGKNGILPFGTPILITVNNHQ
jgi:hypothetical protein